MTEEILTIREGYINDDSVESFQYIEKDTDQGPGSLNNQTELTITYQNQDAWLFPHGSYIRIEGALKTAANANIPNNSAIAFINNAIMYLFSNAKYFLGTQQIEYFENAGITTTIHNYLTKSRSYVGDSWFWLPDHETTAADVNNVSWKIRNLLVNSQAVWNFSAIVPLKVIFNFCNDYRKVLYGMQHKISLTRTNNTRALLRTNNAVAASGIFPALVATANDANVNITTLKWVIPYVVPSLVKQQELMTIIQDKESVPLAFLNKRSESIPVPQATIFSWKLQLTGGIERPRFIVVAFQTNRGVDQTSNSASFDVANLNVTAAYVLLNGIRYPYSDVGTDYDTNKYTKWHHEYLNFYNKYNNDNRGEACLSYFDFIEIAPMYVFDVSNQPEKLKNTSIDVTLNMTFAAVAPANTVAYAVTYFDSMYMLTGDNNKQIIQLFNN
jgi:hypothetical protein